jgi:hypothetical protein
LQACIHQPTPPKKQSKQARTVGKKLVSSLWIVFVCSQGQFRDNTINDKINEKANEPNDVIKIISSLKEK